MKTVGITGGIGSGKTTIMNLLRDKFGAYVIYADNIAHELIEPGTNCYEQIVNHFGPSIRTENGTIDRKVLGEIVFSKKSELDVLNGIVHPQVELMVKKLIDQVTKENHAAFIAVEAAQLLEVGYDQFLDEIWYVYATEDIRVDRLIKSRGYSKKKCHDIIHNQMCDDDFRKKCDYIIDTSEGLYPVEEQINAILNT